MAELFAELRRRRMFRIAAAYLVVAWLAIQVVNNLTPALRLPDWASSFVVVLLLVGFPVVLLFAWVQQMPSQGSAPARNAVLDWSLVGALVVVLLFMGYQQLAPSRTGVDAARSASISPAGAVSVAVLPFANLSSDSEQEFFSDGITEEITGALARVPDLRVVARTSAFEFKGQNRNNIQTIGEQLKATHVIEGSVRKAGDRVRITAQLINAADGTHLWSENYDRELNDIFTIQEDIARAITASLRMPLGLKPGENLVNNRGIDPESYQQYLRAKALYRARGLANVRNAAALAEEVVAKNPDYAPAWALLSWAHTVLPNFAGLANMTTAQLRQVVDSSRGKAEPAAQKAIQLDPGLADGYVALGTVQNRAGKFLLAEEAYGKALALDPNQPEALNMYSQMFSYLGLVDKSLAMRRQSLALEPFDPNSNLDLARLLWLSGEDDAALAILKSLNNNGFIARVQAGAGRFDEAADTLLSASAGANPADALKEAVRLLRAAPEAAAPQDPASLGGLDWVYAFTGAPGRVLEQYERNVEAGWMTNAQIVFLWHRSYAPTRKTERFKEYARKVGFVEYWRAKGWPNACRPVGADDFQCE